MTGANSCVLRNSKSIGKGFAILPEEMAGELLYSFAATHDHRFLKNRTRGREATRTLSTAFPSSISRTSPPSATEIPADAPACTPARDGELREPACSTTFPRQPARAAPSRLAETSRRGLRLYR